MAAKGALRCKTAGLVHFTLLATVASVIYDDEGRPLLTQHELKAHLGYTPARLHSALSALPWEVHLAAEAQLDSYARALLHLLPKYPLSTEVNQTAASWDVGTNGTSDLLEIEDNTKKVRAK